MPPNTVRVSRPGFFGNRYPVVHDRTGWWCMLDRENGLLFRTDQGARKQAVACYREMLDASNQMQQAAIAELRGKNLACWCHLCPAHAAGKPFGLKCDDCAPCHADLLGLVANGLTCERADG